MMVPRNRMSALELEWEPLPSGMKAARSSSCVQQLELRLSKWNEDPSELDRSTDTGITVTRVESQILGIAEVFWHLKESLYIVLVLLGLQPHPAWSMIIFQTSVLLIWHCYHGTGFFWMFFDCTGAAPCTLHWFLLGLQKSPPPPIFSFCRFSGDLSPVVFTVSQWHWFCCTYNTCPLFSFYCEILWDCDSVLLYFFCPFSFCWVLIFHWKQW